MSSSIILYPLIFLKQYFPLNLELTALVAMVGQGTPEVPLSPFLSSGVPDAGVI